MSLLNTYEVEKYVTITAKRADLEVVWQDRNIVATDGKRILLPRLSGSITQAQAEDIMGFVAHEVTHLQHTDFKYMKNHAIDPERSLLGAIFNICEDDGVDAINSAEYHGDRMIRNESSVRLLSSILDKYKEKKKGGPLPAQVEAIMSLLHFHSGIMSDYYTSVSLVQSEVEGLLTPQSKEWADKLQKGDYAKVLKNLRKDGTTARTHGAYEVAKRIYKEVFDQDPEKEEERCKQQQEGEGGEGQEGKEGSKGEKAKQGKGEGDADAPFCNFDYRPYTADQHERFTKQTMVTQGSHIDYSKYKPADWVDCKYTPTPFKNTIVVDYVAGTTNYSYINPKDEERTSRRRHYEELDIIDASDGFANKVRMLLQIRSKGKTQYGTKKGRLHQANTYRVVIQDAPGYNERVFKKRIDTDTLNTAVLVLGDISGSMSGQKMTHQIHAFNQLNDAVGNALRIPLQLEGFTEHECRNAIFLWRKFDTQHLSRENLTRRMAHSSQYMSQNADGDAILYAYHTIKQRKEKRKVLIVTSDGSPASSKGGDIYKYTHNIIQEIEKDKSVDIIAIGIMDTNVKTLYKQHRCISSASELEPALLSIIERKII